ncbi:MAG: FAD-dependent oxidoreductase, partial [bacterium]
MKEHYQVIVVGGGTAGIIAALQAGRAGARTLLIERNGILGGT